MNGSAEVTDQLYPRAAFLKKIIGRSERRTEENQMKRLNPVGFLLFIRQGFHTANRTRYLFVGGILLVLGAFSGPSTVSSQGGLSVENNTNRMGDDYSSFEFAQDNYQTCFNACAADANCRAYTYVRPGAAGPNARCYLKANVPGASGNNCCISGVKSGGGGSGAISAEDNTNRPGADYSSFELSVNNYLLCRDACANDANCRAYTFVRPTVQGTYARCWLKSSAPAGVSSNCCISGAKAGGGGGGNGGGGGGGAGGGGGGGGGNANDIDWNANPMYLKLRGRNGERFTFRCPAYGIQERVRGTDVYTDDSRICLAAVHVGLIGASGGVVTIEMLPAQRYYQGSSRNGVNTQDYDNQSGEYSSYRFVR
jgi:hypothetical protein